MLKLILSRSGYGKTYYVNNELKTRCEQNESGLVLLVPEQFSFESERDMLHLVGAAKLKKIEVLSFTRLCNNFFSKYGGKKKRSINTTGKIAMMETAVRLEIKRVRAQRRVERPETESPLSPIKSWLMP